ncbi:MAG TPA: LysE family transporter, partial [Alphaproteobacteria bacterium]|nr:LysE family transporter [Alphaproteobacteria bacterium]
VHATYCMLGLAFLITQSILIFSTIKYLGAAYLIYIGMKSLLAPRPVQKNVPTPAPVMSSNTAFVQGFLCNVLNPKLAVFLLSLFTQFITPDASMGQKAIVAGVFLVESAIYWPLLVLAVQMPVIRTRLQAMQGAINKICGAVLIAMGARVALSGFEPAK